MVGVGDVDESSAYRARLPSASPDLRLREYPAATAIFFATRIFAGVHLRFDLIKGERLGREVAHFVTGRFLTPLRVPVS